MKHRYALSGTACLALLLLVLPMQVRPAGEPGAGPLQWRANLSTSANTMHKNAFPSVDLIFSGTHNRISARLIVKAGADLNALRLDMAGAQNLQIAAQASALFADGKMTMRLAAPQFFQTKEGKKQEVAGTLVKRESGQLGFDVPSYDQRQSLIIELVIQFFPAGAKEEQVNLKGAQPELSAAPAISATKTDEVIPDSDGDDKATPGETIKYTVTVQNTGDEATDVDYDDTVDPNTTLTPGSIKTTPLAYAQTATVLEDVATPITMTGNDADGGNLTFSIDTAPTKGGTGGVTQNPPSSASVTYTSNANANNNTAPPGADSFVFKVTDADANTKTATVTVNITPVNDAPMFSCGPNQTHNNTDPPTVTVNGWATGIMPGPATATDEAGQTLTFNVTGNTNPAIFSAGPSVNSSNGDLTYTLSGTTGQSNITLTLSDNGGTANGGVDTSVPCSFTVTVNGAPTAVADNYGTQPNTTISRTASDPDDLLDNDDLGSPAANLFSFGGGNLGGSVTDHSAGATVSPLPTFASGSLTVNSDGSFSFTPPTGFTGNYTFDYRITNVAGSSDATVTIAVQAMPSAVADNYNTLINTPISRSTSDPDDLLDNDNLGSSAATLTSFGGGTLGGTVTDNAAGATVVSGGHSLTVNADGSFTYNPASGFTGNFTFNYRLTNVSGSSDALVTIEVRQAPTAVADNYNTPVNTTLSRSTSDPDDLLDNDTRGFPLANLTSFGGGSLGGSVISNAAGASVALAGGTLQVNSDGSFSLTTPTTTGSFTFDYRLTNVAGTSDATVTIEVRQAPTAVADNYVTQVNTTISRSTSDPDDLLDNDNRGFPLATITSFGGGSLGGTVTTNAAGASVALAGGTLTVNSDGSFSLTTPTTAGSFNFQYRLSNVAGNSDATVTIEVQGPPDAIDDAPIATSVPGNAFHTALNTTLNSATDANTPSVLANDNLGFPAGALSHFGGGSLGGAVTDNNAGATATFGTGSLQVNANGEFIFTPDNNFVGLFTFQYRVTNTAGFDDATVTIAVGVRPAAVADSRTATGNIRINTSSAPAFSVLTNDTGDQLTVTAFDATSAQGGNVSVNANGQFTYNPPAGYEGSDSFNYTAGNGFGNGPAAAVSITVSGMIWFINNTAAAGDGRLSSPFNLLSAFQAVNNGTGNNPAAGDNIFIYTGSGDYTGGVTLLNNQKLIGDGSSGSLATIAGITLAPNSDALPIFSGTDPVILNAGGNGISVALDNTIRGLTVGNTPSGFGYSGGAVATLTIQEASKTGTGGALNISSSGTTGVVQFDNLSSSSAPNQAVNLVNVTGTITVNSGSISGPTGTAVYVQSGGVTMDYPGSITKNNAGRLIDIVSKTTGILTFSGNLSNNAVGATGINVITNTGGTITFSGNSKVLNTGANTAVNLVTNAGATINFTGGGLDIDATSGTGFNATGGGTIIVTGAGNTVSTTTGTAVNIVTPTNIGGSGVTFESITVNNGASNSATNAIVLNGTTGSFLVTGDGSQTSGLYDRDGTGGTLNRTTGHSVLLTNASTVTLRKMNITNTATNFDCVNSTSGGNIVLSAMLFQNLGRHGWGVTNITGTNSFDNNGRIETWNTSQANGIGVLQNVNFTSFTVSNSVFTTSATGAVGFLFDCDAGSGTVNVISNEFTLIDQNAVQINNDGSGAITAIVQKNNFHDADATGGDGNNTLFLALAGSGDLNFTIGGPTPADGNTFTNLARLSAAAGVLQVNAAGGIASAGARLNGTIRNNTLTNPGFVSQRRGIMVAAEASAGSHGGHTVTISDNSVQSFQLHGIYVSLASVGGAYDLLNNDITISNNQVGTTGAVGQGGGDSGSAIEFETSIAADNAGADISADILIQNNTAVSNNSSGIGDVLEITNRSGNSTGAGNSSTLNLTVLGNSLTQNNAAGQVFEASNSIFTTTTICLDLNAGNTSANTATGGTGGFRVTNNSGTYSIEGMSAGAQTAAAVQTFLAARNTGGVTATGSFLGEPTGCATP